MIDTVKAIVIAKMSDETLELALQDAWINAQVVARQDQGEALENYYYLESEWKSRQRHKDKV